jgi:hypothetical protein
MVISVPDDGDQKCWVSAARSQAPRAKLGKTTWAQLCNPRDLLCPSHSLLQFSHRSFLRQPLRFQGTAMAEKPAT